MSGGTPTGLLPTGFTRGPQQGESIIGEVTESLHRFLLDGWAADRPPPRIEEDLSFVPKDREEVLYIYMYRAANNTALRNSKQWRPAKLTVAGVGGEDVYYERAPLYLDLFYLIAVHSRFRSDAERLLGWVLLRLHDATHLVYRPRRYLLPDGRQVDSVGRPWSAEIEPDEETIMEKVALAWVDDFTIGDAINFFTIHEAPYRPYLTYCARCALEGALIAGPPTTVRSLGAVGIPGDRPAHERPSGRLGRVEARPSAPRRGIGPPGFDYRPIEALEELEELERAPAVGPGKGTTEAQRSETNDSED